MAKEASTHKRERNNNSNSSSNITASRDVRKEIFQRHFNGLKSVFHVSPSHSHERTALTPYYVTPYSRRALFEQFYLLGTSRSRSVQNAMHTFIPNTPTKEVLREYLRLAELVSLYYDTLDELATLPNV